MTKPLLSIAVPTKDRYEYLIQLIDLVKGFNTTEIELVIQDNTEDNSEILTHISTLDFPQLKYFHSPKQLSVALNCDFSILNSTGKYICLLGDDDGVSEHIVSAVKWMEKMEIDVLKTTLGSYKWPSFNFSRLADLSAVLMMGNYDKRYREIDSKTQLIKTLQNGANSRHGLTLLPKVYHGIAERSTLDKIYTKGGTFFPGPSPDMANSVAMCFVTEKFVFLDFPIVIPGNSVHTGGDSKKYKGQRAPISEIAFLPENTEKYWETFIPKIWSSHTIMPETACKALKYMAKEEFISEYLDKEKMLANFVISHAELKNQAYEKTSNNLKLSLYIYYFLFIKLATAAYNKVILYFFSTVYDGGSNPGGIFSWRNYFTITRKLQSINEANTYLMAKEKNFETK